MPDSTTVKLYVLFLESPDRSAGEDDREGRTLPSCFHRAIEAVQTSANISLDQVIVYYAPSEGLRARVAEWTGNRLKLGRGLVSCWACLASDTTSPGYDAFMAGLGDLEMYFSESTAALVVCVVGPKFFADWRSPTDWGFYFWAQDAGRITDVSPDFPRDIGHLPEGAQILFVPAEKRVSLVPVP